jgi:hypothetical protein
MTLRSAPIKRCLAEHNAEPKPLVWKASAAPILAKLDRLHAPSVFRALAALATKPRNSPRRPTAACGAPREMR